MPKLPSHEFVRVCPGATSTEDVFDGCEAEILLSENNPTEAGYSLVKLNNSSCWYIEAEDVNAFSTGAQGVISNLGSTETFDAVVGMQPDLIHISGDIFAVAYQGVGVDGFVKTIEVTSAGTFVNTNVDSFEFDTSNTVHPNIIHISGNVYAIAYEGTLNDGFIKTITIDTSGNITKTAIDTLEFDLGQALNVSLFNISGNVYAVAYRGPGNDGFIKTIEIDTSGNITDVVIDTLEFDTSSTAFPEIIHISGNIYAIAYEGVDADGFIKTVEIDTSGNITDTVIDILEFDTSDGQEPQIRRVSGNIYMVVYGGLSNAGFIKTIEIDTAGNITDTVIDTLEYDTISGLEPDIIPVVGDVFASIYQGQNSDGFIKTFDVDSTGAIEDAVLSTFEFDTTLASFPKILHLSGDKYLIAYEGNGAAGILNTVDIESTATSVTLTAPNGSEYPTVGSTATITWSSVNTSGNVKLEYSKDDFVSDINSITSSTTDDGSHAWTVPNDPSTTVKIRITDAFETLVSDVSDANFTILTPDTNPISHWSLDENTDCTANDSYDGNDGTLSPDCSTNSPTWTTGKENSALLFDGTDDYVTVGDATNLNPDTAITISAWVKWAIDPTTGNSRAQIISKNGDSQYQLQHNDGNTAFEFALGTSSGRESVVTSTTPSQNVWYFVAGTYDGQTMKLYVDGSLDNSASWSGYITPSANDLDIGRRSVENDRNFNGIIDEVSMWNRALDAMEINTLYLEGNNTEPEIAINSAIQQTDDGFVNISYTLSDAESNFVDLSIYECSLTGDFSGEEVTMTVASADIAHDGISTLSSSPTGEDNVFAWDAVNDLVGTYDETVYIRLKPDDGLEEGGTQVSSAFTVDANAPVVSNVSVEQVAGSNDVEISYDLSEESGDIIVEMDISDDGGLTWAVVDTSVTGDIGSGITSGVGKTITWDAGTDFDGQEEADMQIRLRGIDIYQNTSSYISSVDFALDTKNPLGLNDFSGTSADTSSIVWLWTPVSVETNFDHYEIWYGQDLTDVQNADGTAIKWDEGNDADLAVMGTASTNITGLAEGTTYYAKIWAFDSFGNEITITESQFTTETTSSGPGGGGSEISGGGGGVPLPYSYGKDKTSPDESREEEKEEEPEEEIIEGPTSERILVEIEEPEEEITEEPAPEEITEEPTAPEEKILIEREGMEEEITEEPAPEEVLIDLIEREGPTEEVTTIEDISRAEESPILKAPQVLQVAGTSIGNNIEFSGKGIPNSEVIIFIHSEQAVIYRTQVDENGDWLLSHSQDDIELATGDHEVYTLTLDAESRVKSKPSEIVEFRVEKNYLAIILSHFDMTTTVLTLLLAFIGVVVFLIGRSKGKSNNKQ